MPLPEYVGQESGYDKRLIGRRIQEIFATEARKARRTMAAMDRASILLIPNISNQPNGRYPHGALNSDFRVVV
ncbi:hypothetical protein [Parasitella parasitica]|uniref:Uncharacterized protein n=1 Tax=Parasitella parasitica TaxID=35722 RepID=A0A0B7NF26_9FUNG|nr:hypothetical protein [Parasitella parasitica]